MICHEALLLTICGDIAGSAIRGAPAATSPGDKKTRWLMDKNAWSEVPGTPYM